MKNIIVIALLLIALKVNAQNTKFEVLKVFVSPTLELSEENTDIYLPIKSINEIAIQKADSIIAISKQNIASALALSTQYKNIYITVDNHTIIKITDLNDTVYSGLWQVFMPKGKGYIQRNGVLFEVNDYINNIIGNPNKYNRKMFLINKK